jgi:hypothetical protein
MSNKKQTASEYFFNKMIEYLQNAESENIYEVGTQNTKRWLEIFLDEAKAIENEKDAKINQFLEDEKNFGISDKKTIERIRWYFNTYFNANKETYGE